MRHETAGTRLQRPSPVPSPRRKTCLIAVVVVLVVGSFVPGMARTEQRESASWALVIGISRYVNADPLKFAASDARAFAEFLKSPRGGSFPEDHVITLVEDQATRFRIFSEFESLQDKVRSGDKVFIFMAGHGIVNRRGIGYFVPSDGDVAMLAPTSVPFSFLKELVELGLGGVRDRILVTDLCHSGRIGPETSQLSEKIQNLINRELLGLQGGKQGFINLLGSRPTEPSWERDDLEGGVFSHILLEALNGEAAEPGSESLKAEQVVAYVMMEVPRFTANQQHPMVNQDFDREVALAYPQLPGPQAETETGDCFLKLLDAGLRPYTRIEWTDPLSGIQVIHPITSESGQVRLGPFDPGRYSFRLWKDSSAQFDSVEVELSSGEKVLDLDTLEIGYAPPGLRNRLVSLIPSAGLLVQAVQASAGPTATLVLRLVRGTEIRVDEKVTGFAAADGWVQLEGLRTGRHRIDLIPSPEREYRFRLNLFRGPQLLDWMTGQLRPLAQTPHALDPDFLAGQPQPIRSALMGFERALWNGDLIRPVDRNAWDLLESVRGALPSEIEQRLSRRLLVAMGDKAQRIVLQYLQGGDIHWQAETFEEGTELIVRVQTGLRPNPTLRSQEHFFRGRALLERGSFDEAEVELRRSVELDPEASHALNALALVFWRQNRLETAVQFLGRALSLSPLWTYPRNTLALIRLEQRRYSDSERLFRESMALDPGDSTAVHGLGQLQMLRGEWEAAEASLQQAININPGNAYAQHTLGELYRRQLRFEEAERRLRLAIRLEPDEPSFRISLGNLLRQTGRTTAADPVFRQLLDRQPSNPEVMLAYAGHLALTDRLDQGASLVDGALKLRPQDANLRVKAGLFWLKRDERRARKLFESALDLDADNPYALYDLALLEIDKQRPNRADRLLRRSLEADSRYPAPYLLRGRLLAARGELEEAIEALKTGIQFAVEPAQRQEFEQELDRLQAVWVDARLEDAARMLERRRVSEAARLLSELYREFPDSYALRNTVLSFAARFPERLPPLEPAAGVLAGALRSPFWRLQRELEGLWQQGERTTLLPRLVEGIDHIDLASPLRRTSFNLDNHEFSLHAMILRWVDRLLDAGSYAAARRVLQAALEGQIFAPVPDFSPLTIDSLMVPDSLGHPPAVFSDFEVVHHPDRRVHEAMFLASAERIGLTEALQYLEALEKDGTELDLRNRLAERLAAGGDSEDATELLGNTITRLKTAGSLNRSEHLKSIYLCLTDLQLKTGRTLEAKRTLDEALALWPKDRTLLKRRRENAETRP